MSDCFAKPDVCLISFDSHYTCSPIDGKGTNTPSFMLIESIIALADSDSWVVDRLLVLAMPYMLVMMGLKNSSLMEFSDHGTSNSSLNGCFCINPASFKAPAMFLKKR